jgi:hypothetical protein
MAKSPSRRLRSVAVFGLLPAAFLFAVVVWSGRGAASNNNPLDLADQYICRTQPDGGLVPNGFRVSSVYSSFEKGALVRYRCTFCSGHIANNLSLDTEEIVLMTDKAQ